MLAHQKYDTGAWKALARAVIHGLDHVTPEDLFDLAEDVVLLRIRVSCEASAAGHTGAQVLESILADLGS